MPIVNLIPITGSSFALQNTGLPVTLPSGVGSADLAVCTQIIGDSKYAHMDSNLIGPEEGFGVFMDAGVQIPVGSTITSVGASIYHRCDAPDPATKFCSSLYTGTSSVDIANAGVTPTFSFYDQSPNPPAASLIFTNYTIATYFALDINPFTGLTWTRANLISQWFCCYVPSIGGGVQPCTYDIDYFSIVVNYSSTPNPCYYNPITNQYQSAASPPAPPWRLVTCPAPVAAPASGFVLNPVFGSVAGGD